MNAQSQPPRIPGHPVDDLFVTRWSPRAFAATPLAEAEVLSLLEAARWAPSASNVQPWRFAWALRGEPGFDTIAAALMPFNRVWADRAGALLALGSDSRRINSEGIAVANPTHAFDAGAAWVSLALQARLAGLAAHAMAGFDHAAAARSLGLAEGHVLHAIIAVGHPGDPADLPEPLRAREVPSQRRPLDEIAGRGRFPG
jgi:nitroreductase